MEKTKLLTMGKQREPEDSLPVQLDEGEIGTVDNFTYLGSSISRDGEMHGEVVAEAGQGI